jgi:hypothetical protein
MGQIMRSARRMSHSYLQVAIIEGNVGKIIEQKVLGNSLSKMLLAARRMDW